MMGAGQRSRQHRPADAGLAAMDTPRKGIAGARLYEPVKLVFRGAGLVRCTDVQTLFRRLSAMPATGDEILQVTQGATNLDPASVAALNTMLRVVGLSPFLRAASRRFATRAAARTRLGWSYLGEYLGFQWRRADAV